MTIRELSKKQATKTGNFWIACHSRISRYDRVFSVEIHYISCISSEEWDSRL
jgi:hypothetical protein